MSTNYITAREFKEAGYLQEVNRRFLHPLGLALEADPANDVLRCWDYRDDPEGIVYELDAEHADLVVEHEERVEAEMEPKAAARTERFGWVVQPIADVARERS